MEKQFSEEELLAIEQKWSIRLPRFYRDFLRALGSGIYFSTLGNRDAGLDLRRIDDILEIVASSSKQQQHDVFSKYLPIGKDRETGHLLLLSMDSERDGEIVPVANIPTRWDELDVNGLTGCAFEEWIATRIDTAVN